MDIHKPKPWRGVREFLKEYLIIVVGVLTALAAEAVVENLHWRHEVSVAREAIAFDLREIVARAASKDAESPCVGRRLGEIADILDAAQVSHRLPPMGPVGGPDTPPWGLRSWSALNSGQTLAHISNREQLLLAGLAAYLAVLHEVTESERMEWAVLRTMTGPGRPTSDAEIASLRATLGRAETDAVFQKIGGRQVAALAARSGFVTAREIDADFRAGLEKAKAAPLCQAPQSPAAHSAWNFREILARPPERPTGAAANPLAVGNAGAITTEK